MLAPGIHVYRDGHHHAGPFRSTYEAADALQADTAENNAHSLLWEVVNTQDTPEGTIVGRFAILRSTTGWLRVNIHPECGMPAASTPPPGEPEPSAEWCPVNNCHLSECSLYPDCRGECGHT